MHTVAKLVDTSTCIGCKACEVACQEWNDQDFSVTGFDGTYQTQADLEHNFWNLIKFNELSREDGHMTWNMAKYQCMHCVDPGCLKSCPAPGGDLSAEGRHCRFRSQPLHWLRVLHYGLSVRCPAAEPELEEGLQVLAVFGPDGRRAGAGLHQGVSDELLDVRDA